MNRRHVLPLMMMLPALASCGSTETVTRRIRIIARAEVDGKPVEGSTVMELTWRASGGRMYNELRGEALVLELGGHGTVFVLPTALHPTQGDFIPGIWFGLVHQVVQIQGNGQLKDFPAIEAATGKHEVSGLGPKNYMPLMVAFHDEARKDSIFEVRPDAFAKWFGFGVRFAGLEFEFTDDPLTEVLAKRLPMLTQVDPNNEFPRDPPGHIRSVTSVPLPYKINEKKFFRKDGWL